MSKKGKRLREFEKKNRAFTVREARAKDYSSGESSGALFDIERRDKDSSEKKNNKKKKKVINVKRLTTSAVLLIFVVSVGFSAFKLFKLKCEKDSLMERQAELSQLKEELTAELEHVDSAEYIEQQARKTLRLIKKNEILFVLPDSKNDIKDSDEAEASESGESSDHSGKEAAGEPGSSDENAAGEPGGNQKDKP